ncbi:HD domain-containing protein [Terrarubrum flagellatum]|uniref:HD domain-containing protein n=1 Tax=Terrirubrum flagellatum TaxID=2895980 RepID=UPI0031456F93
MSESTLGVENAAAAFAPRQALAAQLLRALDDNGADGSHDLSHILRVWRNAEHIAASEPGCDLDLLVAAVILHDCVAVEKNSPQRAKASALAAARAREIVAPLDWSAERTDGLAHAIEAHSFSAAIKPVTREARVLQDADRLDAIGAIGVARCFYIAGRMGSSLYEPADPLARHRDRDDRRYALDHFETKLFRLNEGFQTDGGRALAAERDATMRRFVDALIDEIGA